MVTFRESLQNASKAAVCTLLSGTEAASWLGGSLRPGGGNNAFAEAVRKQRLVACDNPDPDVELPESPFQGGQCVGVPYHVTVWAGYTHSSLGPRSFDWKFGFTATVSSQVFGPILGARVHPSQFRVILTAHNSSGQQVDFTGQLWSSGYAPDFAIQSITVVRRDGLPDLCGNIEGPPVPPYTPIVVTREFTYNDNTNVEITEEGDFTIAVPIFVAGNIIAPIKVDVGGVEFPVNFNLETGEITFDFGADYIENPPPIVTENPGENPTDDDPGVESDDLLYGLVVYSTPSGVNPVTSQIAQDSAPTLRLPRTGNVYFQIPIGDRVSWIGPIPVQMENQLIMVPNGMGATGYRLAENTGWNLSAIEVGKPFSG